MAEIVKNEVDLVVRVQVARMELSDLRTVMEIQTECYTLVAPESEQSIKAKLCAAPQSCFIARFSGDCVGYLISVPAKMMEVPALDAAHFEISRDPDCLYIHDVAVSERARGLGAGRMLLEAALDHARKESLLRVCLIAVQNSEAYWRAFGFKSVKVCSDELSRKLRDYGSNATYMTLDLF